MKIILLSDANSIHTLRWAESLKSKNFDIHLFTLFTPNRDIIEKYKKINVKYTSADLQLNIKDLRKPNLSKINYIRSMPLLNRTIKNFNPNILHAHYASSYGILGLLSGFKPFILSVWGSDIYYFPYKNTINKWLLKLAIKNSDEVCSTSFGMKKIIEKEYNRFDIRVISFGIDTRRFKPSKNKEDKFTVGTIKSIEEHNGIDCLLDAASLVKNKYKDIKFLIVGKGSLKKDMQQKAADLQLQNNVKFTGFVPHENVVKYYNNLSIFVAVSRRESFGVSVLEAAACGIPSITSNIGGLNEVNVNNNTGIIINPDDPIKLADSIINLYENEKLRAMLGKNARERVIKKFDWNDNVNQMINIYKKYQSPNNE